MACFDKSQLEKTGKENIAHSDGYYEKFLIFILFYLIIALSYFSL